LHVLKRLAGPRVAHLRLDLPLTILIFIFERPVISICCFCIALPCALSSIRSIISSLQAYEPRNSDVEKMKVAVDLAEFIGTAKHLMPRETNCAVFVDAGWKDGIANIAIVEIMRQEHGVRVIAHSEHVPCESSHEAEKLAAYEGLLFNTSAIVFSDCQPLVNRLKDARLKWIPRRQNQIADKLGNRRRKV